MIYFNGEFIPLTQLKIEPSDRGFLLSDGLFETMRVYEGEVFCLEEHYTRLQKGADTLKIPLPLKLKELNDILSKLLQENNLTNKNATLRITLTRGAGPRGLLPPSEPKSTIMITAAPLSPAEHLSLKLHICTKTRRNEKSPLSNLKSLGYLDNILAKMEASEHKADDAIMLNTKDKVACTSAGNIFIVTHYNTVITPRIEDGILPGITREFVIEHCKKNKIPLIEKELTIENILDAKEIFITNSVLEIQPVAMVNNQPISDGKIGEITIKLKELYKQETKKTKKISIASNEKQYQNPALLVNNFDKMANTEGSSVQPIHIMPEGEKIEFKQ